MNTSFFTSKGFSELCFFSGKLEVSIFSIIAILLLFCTDFSVYTLIVCVSAALHELSHIITIVLCRGKIQKIKVYPFGIDMITDMSILSYKKELACVLSGSLANLVAAGIAHMLFGTSDCVEACFFIYANVFLGIGNLVPIPVFDGGRALHIIISLSFLPDLAYNVQKWVDTIAYFTFFVFSMIVFLYTKCNLTLVICVCCSALAAVISEKRALPHRYTSRL